VLKTSATAAQCFDWDYRKQFYKRNQLVPLDCDDLDGKVRKGGIDETIHGMIQISKDTAASVLSRTTHPLLIERESYRERVYKRNEHQPLGKCRQSDNILPAFTKEYDFRFGDKTELDVSVGKIIHPEEIEKSAESTRRQILSEPGHQKRHYGEDWKPLEQKEKPEVDPFQDNRVSTALYWSENPARFHSETMADVSQITDKVSMHPRVFKPDYTIYSLMGNSPPPPLPPVQETRKWKFPPAGRATIRADDLDLKVQIVPKLNPLEDRSLVRKITEEVRGGTPKSHRFGDRCFGLKSVRDPSERIGKVRGVADQTSYGDELDAKGLIYPTARNIYGKKFFGSAAAVEAL